MLAAKEGVRAALLAVEAQAGTQGSCAMARAEGVGAGARAATEEREVRIMTGEPGRESAWVGQPHPGGQGPWGGWLEAEEPER
jgi:hypothetical protein